jgi:hypothetical protein
MNALDLWKLREEHLAGFRVLWFAIGNCAHIFQLMNKDALAEFNGF